MLMVVISLELLVIFVTVVAIVVVVDNNCDGRIIDENEIALVVVVVGNRVEDDGMIDVILDGDETDIDDVDNMEGEELVADGDITDSLLAETIKKVFSNYYHRLIT